MKKSLKLLSSLVIFFTPKTNACHEVTQSCHCFPYQSDYVVTTDYDFDFKTATFPSVMKTIAIVP